MRRVRLKGMRLRDRVALNIQELRRARGLSQEALAHQANVSRGHMGRLENSKFAASLDLLERIAKALNVDPQELSRGVNPLPEALIPPQFQKSKRQERYE